MSNRTPFIAFDTFALRDLIGRLTDNELRLYLLMCTYADGKTSRLWPGIPTLSDASGMAPTTVHRTLDRLNAKGMFDYIRRDEIDPVTRRQQVNVYQVCGPFLPADSIKSVSTLKHEKGTTTINNNNQLKQSVNNNQEPASAATQRLRAPLTKAETSQAAANGENTTQRAKGKGTAEFESEPEQKTKANRKDKLQRANDKSPSPGSVAPSPRDLSVYHAPLADSDRERMAARIEAECETTTAYAREMAATYPLEAVEAALSEMRAAAQGGRIKKSKYGFTLYQLQHNTVSPEDTAKARRAAAVKTITAGGLLVDQENGQTCQFVTRAGNQLVMQYDDGQNYTVSIDAAINLYTPANAAVGE